MSIVSRARTLKLPAKLRLLLGAALAFGCAEPARPAREPEPPVSSSQPVGGQGFEDRGWGVLRSTALGLKLALPDARAWSEAPKSPTEATTWRLQHLSSGTRLDLRRWRSSRLPRVETCDTELRQRMSGLVPPDESTLVAQREVRVPQGFITRITLLAMPAPPSAGGGRPWMIGQAVAVGAGIGECLAAVAQTETATEAALAERLRLLDAALGHIRLTQIEDRVPAPTPPAP